MSAFARSAHPPMPGSAVSVRVLVAAGVLALHVGAIAWALRAPPDDRLAPDDDVLMVSFIPTAATAIEPAAPLPPPLKTERPPVLATERRIEAAPEAPAVTPVVEEAVTPSVVDAPPIAPPAAAVSAAPVSTAVAGSEGDSRTVVCPNNTIRQFPAGLLRAGEKTSAVFWLNISAEGRVKKVEVKQSSGSAQIDLHGRRQIRNWKCLPKIENDRPVESWASLTLRFSN